MGESIDLRCIENDFNLELGYCYTEPTFQGKGISTNIVALLLEKSAKNGVIATTEIQNDNPMKKILLKQGFRQFGKVWKSKINNGTIGLFIRFVN